MLCIGKSIVLFILGRLFQGISAAVVWVVGLALLVDTVGKDEIARSMGIVSVALSAATFLAPLLGGVVYDR
jgi:MFS family permease